MKIGGILICVLCFLQYTTWAAPKADPIIFCGSETNDLYKVLEENGFQIRRFDVPASAIHSASEGAAVFIVADGYPAKKNDIGPDLLKLARRKYLRIYLEYPSSLPGIDISDTVIEARLERGIVVSGVFGSKLKPMSILGINDCHIIPSQVDSSLIVLGKVAGFDKASYGIKDVKTYPILFQRDNMMVAMTGLSNFATGRYGPVSSWKRVWEYILSWMTGNKN